MLKNCYFAGKDYGGDQPNCDYVDIVSIISRSGSIQNFDYDGEVKNEELECAIDCQRHCEDNDECEYCLFKLFCKKMLTMNEFFHIQHRYSKLLSEEVIHA